MGQTLYPTAIVSKQGLDGLVSDIDDDPASPDGSWCVQIGTAVGWSTIPAQSLTVDVAFTLNLANYDPPGTGSYAVNGTGDALPAGLSLNTSTGVVSGTPTTAQTKNVKFDATPSAESDWLARSTAAGVVWSHAFASDTEVSKFTNVAGGVDPARVVRAASGGPNDFGYLRCLVPQGVGAAANVWERPLSALPGDVGYVSGPDFSPSSGYVYGSWPRGYYGHSDYWSAYPGQFAGDEFYVQMRVRVTRGRWTTAHEGGKVLWFADTGYTPAQELNYQALYDGRLAGYIDFGAANTYVTNSPQVTPAAGQVQKWQAGGLWDATCAWTVGQSYPTNCWKWPGYYSEARGNEWVVVLLRVKLGHECGSFTSPNSGSDDSEIDVWIAEEADLPSNGGSGYRQIISRTNALWVYTDNRVRGLNSLRLSAYFNGLIFNDAWEQDFAQVIFSTQTIACPQL